MSHSEIPIATGKARPFLAGMLEITASEREGDRIVPDAAFLQVLPPEFIGQCLAGNRASGVKVMIAVAGVLNEGMPVNFPESFYAGMPAEEMARLIAITSTARGSSKTARAIRDALSPDETSMTYGRYALWLFISFEDRLANDRPAVLAAMHLIDALCLLSPNDKLTRIGLGYLIEALKKAGHIEILASIAQAAVTVGLAESRPFTADALFALIPNPILSAIMDPAHLFAEPIVQVARNVDVVPNGPRPTAYAVISEADIRPSAEPPAPPPEAEAPALTPPAQKPDSPPSDATPQRRASVTPRLAAKLTSVIEGASGQPGPASARPSSGSEIPHPLPKAKTRTSESRQPLPPEPPGPAPWDELVPDPEPAKPDSAAPPPAVAVEEIDVD